jgi:hypothetical protein
MSIRGAPSLIRSDRGSQLVGANNKLKAAVKGIDQTQLEDYGADNGFKWEFTDPNAPWKNGCAEALIKSAKRAITTTIGEQVMMYSELQTVFYEIANLMNERPIGKVSPDPDDGKYLCPNDLLLGRATARISQQGHSKIPMTLATDKSSSRN